MLDTGIDVPEVLNLVFFKTGILAHQVLADARARHPPVQGFVRPRCGQGGFSGFRLLSEPRIFSQNLPGAEGAASEPLSTRLFRHRLALIAGLDKRHPTGLQIGYTPPAPYGGYLSESELRAETTALLHQQVAAMCVDNFVVRPQRGFVERFAGRSLGKAE